MSFRLGVDLSGLEKELNGMSAECEAAARPASQAMAQVLYDEVEANVAKIGVKTGNLRASIYQVYSDKSDKGRAIYHISWNARKAPHGHLVEFGHLMTHAAYFSKKTGRWYTDKRRPIVPKQVAARPFIRPAVFKFPQAEQAGTDRLLKELQDRGVIT